MTNAAQPSRSDKLSSAGSVCTGGASDWRPLRGSSRTGVHPNNPAFRWVVILVVSILLWLIGVDWRTLVMIAGAAAMFAMAIDQMENVSDG